MLSQGAVDVYKLLSPSQCAKAVAKEITAFLEPTDEINQRRLQNLLRQYARDIVEECACVAEDWVPDHDNDDQLHGEEVGDGIAETLRCLSEERRQSRD